MGYNQDCQVRLLVPANRILAATKVVRDWYTATYGAPSDGFVIEDGLCLLLGEAGHIELIVGTGEYVGSTWGKCNYEDETVLSALAEVGVTGTVDARGEDDRLWRWRMKDGKLLTCSGEIHYPTDPDGSAA